MKAIVQDRYGSADVLELRDIDVPVVGETDVLVRVHAAGCGPDVWHTMTGQPYFARLMLGFRRPKLAVRGGDVAGTVEAVGESVADLHPGDEVMGVAAGSFAELAVAPSKSWSASRPDFRSRRPRPFRSRALPPSRPSATRAGCSRDRKC
jgi:NADPH:quinone reductase-like Zn-dependent oxidoreductase